MLCRHFGIDISPNELLRRIRELGYTYGNKADGTAVTEDNTDDLKDQIDQFIRDYDQSSGENPFEDP